MIRAHLGDAAYWNKWAEFGQRVIERNLESIKKPAVNKVYESQYGWDLSKEFGRRIITRYSRGDSIHELAQHFPGLLDAWELSNRLAADICREHNLKTCRDWTFELSNINHYNWCFWLVGLALALEIPDDQWQRLLVLIDGEGEDILLDRIIASRSPQRKIGDALLHKKPYTRLLNAIDAPTEQHAALLKEFVGHWYAELKRPAKQELWWYIYGDPEKNPLKMGSYFGRWCIEAVAAVKAFGLDDSLCLGHEHYPGDLLRPDGPSTHPLRPDLEQAESKSWWPKWFKKSGNNEKC